MWGDLRYWSPLPFPCCSPLFVTWSTISKHSGHKRLRGCIGNFEANPIGAGLKDYAAIRFVWIMTILATSRTIRTLILHESRSAFKDTRFNPIASKELHKLACGCVEIILDSSSSSKVEFTFIFLPASVSLLTNFELCENYLDWSIDIHGIYIQLPNPLLSPCSSSSSPSIPLAPPTNLPRPSFRSISLLPKFAPPSSRLANPKRLSSILTATYLPDVAKEQGWTKVEAVDSCIEKAGYRGEIGEEVRRSCRVYRYQSEKVEVGYKEWVEWQERQKTK